MNREQKRFVVDQLQSVLKSLDTSPRQEADSRVSDRDEDGAGLGTSIGARRQAARTCKFNTIT